MFLQGANVENIYLLKRGKITLNRTTTNGNSLILHTAYAGEMFAEASLFADVYHCYSTANSVCEVGAFSKKDVLEFFVKNPKKC